MRAMKVAGLFAGVGGIEVGFDRAGHSTEFLCDIDPCARAVLRRRFPGVPVESDIRKVRCLPKNVELLAAGFPCQDLSQAGSTNGICGSRSGLIRHVFRLIAAHQPPWVLIENVPFLLQLQSGRGIAYLVRQFERLGYRWGYRVLDTRAFGLPQRRERVFLLASLETDPSRYLFMHDRQPPQNVSSSEVAHGFYWTEGTRGLGWAVDSVPTLKGGSALGIPSPPAIWFPDGRFATPDVRDAERLQGFPADWTRPAEVVGRPSYRWTLVGNAVSVPVAHWFGRLLKDPPGAPPPDAVELHCHSPWPKAAFGGPRSARFAVNVGSWPVVWPQRHLHEFLRFGPKPLSRRAAAGFRNRLLKSSLFRPVEFDRALTNYVQTAV